MCEESLNGLIQASFADKYSGYNLDTIDSATIDKLNDMVYVRGSLGGALLFFEMTFENNVFNYDDYSSLYKNSLNNIDKSKILKFLNVRSVLEDGVSESSCNTFLDTIVKDQGFKDVLATEGIVIVDDVSGWLDVTSVVNIRNYDRKSVIVKFIDLNNQKTLEVMVYSDLNIQESGNSQYKIKNLTIKEKTYTILEVKDFATFPDPT